MYFDAQCFYSVLTPHYIAESGSDLEHFFKIIHANVAQYILRSFKCFYIVHCSLSSYMVDRR